MIYLGFYKKMKVKFSLFIFFCIGIFAALVSGVVARRAGEYSVVYLQIGQSENAERGAKRFEQNLQQMRRQTDPVLRFTRHIIDCDPGDEVCIYSEIRKIPAHAKSVFVTLNVPSTKAVIDLLPVSNVVFAVMANPNEFSLLKSPSGESFRSTGIELPFELEEKVIEMTKLAFPRVRRIGVVGDREYFSEEVLKNLRAFSSQFDIEFKAIEIEDDLTLVAFMNENPLHHFDAMFVPTSRVSQRVGLEEICDIFFDKRLPTVIAAPLNPKRKCALSYDQRRGENMQQLAAQTLQVIRSEGANTLPVLKAQQFDLGINLDSISTLGLDVSEESVLSARFVILNGVNRPLGNSAYHLR
jgi:ABC-type uncharacterized transport system substrate-binding protein